MLRRAIRERHGGWHRAQQRADRRHAIVAKAALPVVIARKMVAGGLAVPRASLHLHVPQVRRRSWPASFPLSLREMGRRVAPGVVLANRGQLTVGGIECTAILAGDGQERHVGGRCAAIDGREHRFNDDWSRPLLARLLGRRSVVGRLVTQKQLWRHGRTLGRREHAALHRPLVAPTRVDDAAVPHAHERATDLLDAVLRGVPLATVAADKGLLAVFARH